MSRRLSICYTRSKHVRSVECVVTTSSEYCRLTELIAILGSEHISTSRTTCFDILHFQAYSPPSRLSNCFDRRVDFLYHMHTVFFLEQCFATPRHVGSSVVYLSGSDSATSSQYLGSSTAGSSDDIYTTTAVSYLCGITTTKQGIERRLPYHTSERHIRDTISDCANQLKCSYHVLRDSILPCHRQ